MNKISQAIKPLEGIQALVAVMTLVFIVGVILSVSSQVMELHRDKNQSLITQWARH